VEHAWLFAALAVVFAPIGCFKDEPGGCRDATCSGEMDTSSGSVVPTTGGDATTSTSTGEIVTGAASTGSSGAASSSDDGTTAAPPGVPIEGAAFRVSRLEIVDPHLYLGALFCQDATGFLNSGVSSAIEAHEANLLLLAKDYDPDADTQTFLVYRDADCPQGADHCVLDDAVLPTTFVAVNKDDGNCLDVQLSTVNPANVEMLNLPVAPCVTSPTASLQLELPGLDAVTLYMGKFSARYEPGDADPTALVDAILYGFIPKADAETLTYTFMDMVIDFWSMIRGSDHPDACPVPMDGAPGSVPDVDTLDLDGDGPMPPTPGVYLYMNFTAERVDLYAPF